MFNNLKVFKYIQNNLVSISLLLFNNYDYDICLKKNIYTYFSFFLTWNSIVKRQNKKQMLVDNII